MEVSAQCWQTAVAQCSQEVSRFYPCRGVGRSRGSGTTNRRLVRRQSRGRSKPKKPSAPHQTGGDDSDLEELQVRCLHHHLKKYSESLMTRLPATDSLEFRRCIECPITETAACQLSGLNFHSRVLHCTAKGEAIQVLITISMDLIV